MTPSPWQPILRIRYGLELQLDVHSVPAADWIVAWRRLDTAARTHGWGLRDSEASQAAWIHKALVRDYKRTLWDAFRPAGGGPDPVRVAGGLGAIHTKPIARLGLLRTAVVIGRAAGFRLSALEGLDWALSPRFSNPYEQGPAWSLGEPTADGLLARAACEAACASDWPRSGLGAALDRRPRMLALLRSINCPAVRQ